jgi:macrolide-specific efflux system membrane fusion protein
LRAVEPAPESIAAESSGPAASAQSNANSAIYYNGLFEISDPAHELRISMTAQVNVVLAESAHAVSIPSVALGPREKDGRYTITTLGPDGKPLERKISIGINNNVSAEVLSGLTVGERVIVAQALDPGDAKRRSARLF